MVEAGNSTGAVINDLVDAMEEGDIIIDGGNALYTDTIRREKAIRELPLSGALTRTGAIRGPHLHPGRRRDGTAARRRRGRYQWRRGRASPARS